jgi:RNA polymerase sigma-70 factor, ECF subfamily
MTDRAATATGSRETTCRKTREPDRSARCRGTVGSGGPDLEDAELISHARMGDVRAYEDLVRRYQDVALRTAYLVAPEADAADAVQDAFLKAYAALPRFRDGAPFRPWLLRIVANEGRNRRRSANRRAGLAERAAIADPRGSVSASPESEIVAAETRRALLAAMTRLRDDDREVIGARYLLDLSEAETAETLGLPRGTVKSRTSRALGRLRAVLAELEAGPTHD